MVAEPQNIGDFVLATGPPYRLGVVHTIDNRSWGVQPARDVRRERPDGLPTHDIRSADEPLLGTI